ncbi:MAG: beta-lactamase family protein [Flavobacteriales bacterium]|nr:beta-lactamase family protein [Flavobacteriales bacterium]
MKTVLKVVKWVAIVVVILVAGLYLSGNQFLLKGMWAAYLHGNTSATISDAKFFDTRTVEAGTANPWKVAAELNKKPLSDRLRSSLEDTRSVAFLIAQGGEITYEEYWDGYSDSSRSNSFSMAKSITTMLTQCAIQDGYIDGWDAKAIKLLPELKGEYAEELTLRNLSTMTAGLDFNEHYTNPFDITAKLYYGPDARELMLENVPVITKPGTYEYQSGATQLLGLAVMTATGKSLAEYASEKLWKPMGATHSVEWHLDSEDGKELAFCCFNSNARDFARFGQMMLQKGNYNGVQILDTAFVDMATVPFVEPYYGHSFWMTDEYGTHIFYQRGILGQYIIVIPEYDMVVVRLGHERLGNDHNHTTDFRVIVEELMKDLR